MGKHAYMIMVHEQPQLLKKLLSALDHKRNDIFLHIDLKSSIDGMDISGICRYSNVYLTERICVFWGGYSQIRAELILLKTALKTGCYDYYHLLTGVDFPLLSQEEILQYFDNNEGKEFISLTKCPCIERVKFYYPFQDKFNRHHFIGIVLRKIGVSLQTLFQIDRTKKCSLKWGYGSAYFDITDDVARYICSQEKLIQSIFKDTFCADEIFLQTIYLNSPFFESKKRNKSIKKHPHINDLSLDINRAIDFSRGNPYTYKIDDLKELCESGCFFARKCDYEKYPELIDALEKRILK